MRPGPLEQRNGSARLAAAPDFAAAGGGTLRSDDEPLTKVFALDASSAGAARWLGYLLGAVALMLGLAVGVRLFAVLLAMTETHVPPSTAPQEIDVMRDEPAPTPPPPAAAPGPEVKPEPPPPPPKAARHDPPPPPSPAQAGKVLAQEPNPNEPVDLTGNTIVSGEGEYRGGVTAGNGTNTNAVRGPTSPTGVVGGTGPVITPPSGPDRSRKASLGGGTNWECPFPAEADTAQIDDTYVILQVEVGTDGSPSHVRVIRDPGNGFGREALRCALQRHYETALDHDGQPMAGVFSTRVHFSR
ncbi:MAG: energy transducer TonB [Polyangiaceae bacterium]|jgi:protein TonB